MEKGGRVSHDRAPVNSVDGARVSWSMVKLVMYSCVLVFSINCVLSITC